MTRVTQFASAAWSITLWLGAALSISAVIIAGMFWISGLRPIVITSGSMSPTIPVGSLVVARHIESTDAKVGDVITARLSATRRVTHRVAGITNEDNQTQLWLKGDANAANDASPITSRSVLREEGTYPGLGKPLIALKSSAALVVIGIGLGAIVLSLVGLARKQSDDISDSFGQELRNPLTSIVGYAELLCEGEVGRLDDEQLRIIEIMKRNADRLTGLVSRVP